MSIPDETKQHCLYQDDGGCHTHQKINNEGKCEDCPPYQFPDIYKKNCLPLQCDNQILQIVNIEGECETCPILTMVDSRGI